MNQSFLDLVRGRCSTRRFADRPVPREMIDQCLEAARLAPSACNSQPWSFIVADQPAARDRVAAAAFTGVYAMNRFAAAAPVLVAMLTERSRFMARLGGQFRGIQYSLVDIGIAGEHFVLQAAEQGLGTCWLGWFNEKAVKRALHLPRSARIDILIALGYPETESSREKKRKSLDEIRKYIE